jgi:hypothetical protein
MALLFMDGFDKYGGVNTNVTSVAALMAGEWTTITNAVTLVAPLSATGQAISITGGNAGPSKTLPAAVGRIIGGMRFSSNLAAIAGVQFNDGASNQCSISIASTGIITMRNGAFTIGTILGSSATSITANTTHYLEWDISLGNSAAYNVYLDGVSVVSGTGDTTATANNTVSVVMPVTQTLEVLIVDDFYLFDSTGSTNNAPLLTSPRIETTLPISDSAVQFSIGASVLGPTVNRGGAAINGVANTWYVRAFTPQRACTLNTINITPNVTNSTANLRPVVYSDSAGAPSTLLSGGSTVTGTTAGTLLTMPLTTPQTLTAGTQYWLGFMTDVAVQMVGYDGVAGGRSGTATFTSGAPSTAPSSASASNVLMWGNITLTTPVNFYEVNQQPPPGVNSYVYDATVSGEDLYGFGPLSVSGATVYGVGVKGMVQKSDSGTRTISLRTRSGSTDSAGSLAGQALGTSFGWYGSFFATDPNTGGAWTTTAVNAATSGIRIDS